MKGNSQELRYYWARFNELLMKDGILGSLNNCNDGATLPFEQLCLNALDKESLSSRITQRDEGILKFRKL